MEGVTQVVVVKRILFVIVHLSPCSLIRVEIELNYFDIFVRSGGSRLAAKAHAFSYGTLSCVSQTEVV